MKIFEHICVLDTSVMLSVTPDELNVDGRRFIILYPTILELEAKRGHRTLGFFAREWLRFIESLKLKYDHKILLREIENLNFNKISGEASWLLYMDTLTDRPSNADDEIIAFCRVFPSLNGNPITLLSNDLPLRLRAFGEDTDAYPYISTNVGDKEVSSGVVEVFDDPQISGGDYTPSSVLPIVQKSVKTRKNNIRNFIVNYMSEDGEYLLTRFLYKDKTLTLLSSLDHKPMSITPRSDEQKAAISYLIDPKISIVSLSGVAGSGKTSLAIATAVSSVQSGEFEKVVVYRSLHEMGVGQEMGFLPGDVDEKMQPWSGAVNDAVEFIVKTMSKGKKRTATSKKDLLDLIDIQPITYLRGRSLTNSVIIIEEAQNLSRVELLNILSRIGDNSKVILTFDPTQVDNKFLASGVNSEVWSIVEGFIAERFFAHVNLPKSERSKVAEKASSLLLNL